MFFPRLNPANPSNKTHKNSLKHSNLNISIHRIKIVIGKLSINIVENGDRKMSLAFLLSLNSPKGISAFHFDK